MLYMGSSRVLKAGQIVDLDGIPTESYPYAIVSANNGSGTEEFPIGTDESLKVFKEGTIWVETEGKVNEGDTAYYKDGKYNAKDGLEVGVFNSSYDGLNIVRLDFSHNGALEMALLF